MSAKQAQGSRQKEHAEDKQVGEQGRLWMKGEESRMSGHQDRDRHQESARPTRLRPHPCFPRKNPSICPSSPVRCPESSTIETYRFSNIYWPIVPLT